MSARQSDDVTQSRASHWNITINNPTPDDGVRLRQQPRWLRRVCGQLEEAPTTGTPHLQVYANTQQVRFAAIKEWLPRAKIIPVYTKEHVANMLNYVKKMETAVADSKFDYDYRSQLTANMTMAQTMVLMAGYRFSDDEIMRMRNEDRAKVQEAMTMNTKFKPRTDKEIMEIEFWHIVNELLLMDENLVGLLTQPQYLRTWLNTRKTWVVKYELDSQTKIKIENKIPTSSIDDGSPTNVEEEAVETSPTQGDT